MLNISKPLDFDVNKWKADILHQFEDKTSTTAIANNKIETITVLKESTIEEIKTIEPEIKKLSKILEESEAKPEIQQTAETKTSKTKRKEQIDQKSQVDNKSSLAGTVSHLSKNNVNKKNN